MTVKELIETLKTCDENANAVIEQWDGDIYDIENVKVGTKTTNTTLTCITGFVLQWAKYGLKK